MLYMFKSFPVLVGYAAVSWTTSSVEWLIIWSHTDVWVLTNPNGVVSQFSSDFLNKFSSKNFPRCWFRDRVYKGYLSQSFVRCNLKKIDTRRKLKHLGFGKCHICFSLVHLNCVLLSQAMCARVMIYLRLGKGYVTCSEINFLTSSSVSELLGERTTYATGTSPASVSGNLGEISGCDIWKIQNFNSREIPLKN